jgi:hypothetical protein
MERNILEIMASQQKMLQDSGKTKSAKFSMDLMDRYKSNLQQVSDWSKRNNSFVDILYVPYQEMLSNPQKFIPGIKQFLNFDLDEVKMGAAIDKSLHRIKNIV